VPFLGRFFITITSSDLCDIAQWLRPLPLAVLPSDGWNKLARLTGT
jgi:hypothetical protein